MQAAMRIAFILAHAVFVPATGTEATAHANPIRKVVNLLQAMQKKVTAEQERADELHKKFVCYCASSTGGLDKGIAAAQSKIPELQADIKSSASRKTQLQADLKLHNSDRISATKAMSEASFQRQKDKAAYDKELADTRANNAALAKAVTAIENGMGGAFLQMPAAGIVRAIVTAKSDMDDEDRDGVLSFLSGNDQYAPGSGEILGILKQMHDEFQKSQEELMAGEKEAVQSHEGLMAAKKREVATLTKSIEAKLGRTGDLSVEVATMKNDLEDTEASLAEDSAFAGDLKKDCANAGKNHEADQKMRGQELVALADTIKILNDDDALDLFKKTLPGASASFMQVQESTSMW